MNTDGKSYDDRRTLKSSLRNQRGNFIGDILTGVVVMGVLLGAVIIVVLTTGMLDTSDPDAPEPVKAPVKEPPAEVDMSWLWQAGGALLMLAVAAGLSYGGYVLWKKSAVARRAADAAREHAADAAREHAAALVMSASASLNEVMLSSASYETDLAKQIDFPMMTDVTEPAVSAYLKDMRRALDLQPLAAGPRATGENTEQFVAAVHALELSFRGATVKAERLRWSSFTVDEQSRLKDARTALAVIHDTSTTPEQRNAQYRRITKLLDGLIVMTAPVLRELSAVVPMLVLEELPEREPAAV